MTFDALLAHGPPAGPAWLDAVRADARARFRAPTTKDEAWRFTPLRPLTSGSLEGASARVTVSAPESVEIRGAAAGEGRLGTIAAATHFSALNAALFDDAIVIRFAGGARARVELTIEAPSGVTHPRVLVIVERSARATLVESHRGDGPGLVNAVVEIALAEGAELEHVRSHDGAPGARAVETIAVRQAAGSRYTSRAFSFGGALSRLEIACALEGEGAVCELDGLYLTSGDSSVAHHTLVRHAVAGCSSRQKYKGVLRGTSRVVFDGTIIVARDAQRTDAHQKNDTLLLSDDAVVNTKPRLEIDADDVKVSHGATVGRLDDQALFYCRARGIALPDARSILVDGFAREMVDRVADAAARESLSALLGGAA